MVLPSSSSPPSISPRQLNLMRIVASMAWSDGNLAEEELQLMLDRFSSLFAATAERQHQLREELQAYLVQNIPLDELTPKLKTPVEKELVLRLGYEVIGSSARTPEEAVINDDEAAAYQRLVGLLGLPADAVTRIEVEAKAALEQQDGSLIDLVTDQLRSFIQQ
ncbi:MAG: TerB family tellurite resistance protein [Cyanobacteria bacterium P01_A01_bin.123]